MNSAFARMTHFVAVALATGRTAAVRSNPHLFPHSSAAFVALRRRPPLGSVASFSFAPSRGATTTTTVGVFDAPSSPHRPQQQRRRPDRRWEDDPFVARFARATGVDDAECGTTTTRYTIDDDVCPPTDAEHLIKVVSKHEASLEKYLSSKPVAGHTSEAFAEAEKFVEDFAAERRRKRLEDGIDDGDDKLKLILDSGCGTGKSTVMLGKAHPDCFVIGIDRSIARLNKNKSYRSVHTRDEDEGGVDGEGEGNEQGSKDERRTGSAADIDVPENVLLVRAELSDFWRCCLTSETWKARTTLVRHYLLYPNPYPKKARLKSRWYAHPAFPLLMQLIGDGDEGMVVRSNWKRYLEEFALSVGVVTDDASNAPRRLSAEEVGVPLTNFEAKYLECGEPIYELVMGRSSSESV